VGFFVNIKNNKNLHKIRKEHMFYECKQCGDSVPIERKTVAKFFTDYCVDCASLMDSSIKAVYSLVPTHKGAYQPVTNKKQIYDATCNPKNFDFSLSEALNGK
jgi:ribosomal protein S26